MSPGPSPGIHESWCDDTIEVPAVGAGGRPAEGLPALEAFMGLSPFDAFPARPPQKNADFNLDDTDEIGVFRSGMWFLSYSPDFAGVDQATAFGSPTPGMDSPDLGEFGCSTASGAPEGVEDLVTLRSATSTWSVSQSAAGFPGSPSLVVSFGTTTHKKLSPRRLDTTGDRCSDFGVFRNGCFTLLESPAYNVAGLRKVCFGLGTDEPVSGDLDGDGRSDLILWRAGTSHYTYRLSPLYQTDLSAELGQGNVPVVGDVNGDGMADLGSYTAATSTFRFTYSPDFVGVDLTVAHGVNGDVPVLADVNGDWASDLGVFRPAVARWSFLCSPGWSARCLSQSFGVAGDIPIYGKPAGIP